MSRTWDYTSFFTWYASTNFPSKRGAVMLLSHVVVPALKDLLARKALDGRFNDFDFLLFRDRLESTPGGYVIVLAFRLNGELAHQLEIYPQSSNTPTVVLNTAGTIRRFADVDGAVQLPYESFEP
ncbi:hypothetical protein GALMADRAFT_139560 [Galerina marginata CBS 339.88]|uniref:Uncharacterized protein n=1 Tax=Galerina marginata (strain CBS 339.88) TaxID=685588 RepID=A0A067TCD3_GALM3|nr:hypothetical protein GALMADRAFT_139560 [Galerina marginata CBS 339.88]